ncbi:MAG: GDP-mannose 4,6-dehydratase [Proteobacteria bacterium]|jgi:GDP-4-dehydro-6-deoxy-D-mannose reductase|nr:GDP-mannose 4,6-dehydratase [Pseudomonadota bacterium]
MKKALITGGEGFVGGHLKTELEENGYQVFLTSRVAQEGYIKMDLCDYEEVRSVINEVKPDVIFHLGAIAFVPSSWQDAELTMNVNLNGSLHLLDAVRSIGIDPVIQLAGSSEEYGMVYPEETPMTEENPLRPLSPYAVSKIAMDFLAYQYHKSYGLKTIRVRAFNHSGYGRGEAYMTSTFAKQLVEIEKGKRDLIKHGDLSSIRDITDVRDTVRAYRLLTEKGKYGEVYNIGTGKGYSAQEILNKLSKLMAMTPKTEIDPDRMRPSDVKILIADASKVKAETGWEPQYSIDETLSEVLRYWMERI